LAAAEVSAALVVQVLAEAQPPVPAQVPVLAHLVVEAAVPLDLLSRLSRQSFSAAMAKSST
jgi:hypothetical protein